MFTQAIKNKTALAQNAELFKTILDGINEDDEFNKLDKANLKFSNKSRYNPIDDDKYMKELSNSEINLASDSYENLVSKKQNNSKNKDSKSNNLKGLPEDELSSPAYIDNMSNEYQNHLLQQQKRKPSSLRDSTSFENDLDENSPNHSNHCFNHIDDDEEKKSMNEELDRKKKLEKLKEKNIEILNNKHKHIEKELSSIEEIEEEEEEENNSFESNHIHPSNKDNRSGSGSEYNRKVINIDINDYCDEKKTKIDMPSDKNLEDATDISTQEYIDQDKKEKDRVSTSPIDSGIIKDIKAEDVEKSNEYKNYSFNSDLSSVLSPLSNSTTSLDQNSIPSISNNHEYMYVDKNERNHRIFISATSNSNSRGLKDSQTLPKINSLSTERMRRHRELELPPLMPIGDAHNRKWPSLNISDVYERRKIYNPHLKEEEQPTVKRMIIPGVERKYQKLLPRKSGNNFWKISDINIYDSLY